MASLIPNLVPKDAPRCLLSICISFILKFEVKFTPSVRALKGALLFQDTANLKIREFLASSYLKLSANTKFVGPNLPNSLNMNTSLR